MGALLVLLIIVGFSLLAVKVGATALMLTGVSWDTASFQAYSAFFGTGFTTKEAELVVNHPVRRKIIRHLILVGNIGLTSAFATLIVTFLQTKGTEQVLRTLGFIALGTIGLWLVVKIGILNRAIDRVIRYTLERAGMVRIMDYELLLRVRSGFCISEIEIAPDSPLAGKPLRSTRPADMGMVVLGITRSDGSFTGAPRADECIETGDVLTVYGNEADLSKIAHGKASAEEKPAGP